MSSPPAAEQDRHREPAGPRAHTSSMLARLRELAAQVAGGTLGTADRQLLQERTRSLFGFSGEQQGHAGHGEAGREHECDRGDDRCGAAVAALGDRDQRLQQQGAAHERCPQAELRAGFFPEEASERGGVHDESQAECRRNCDASLTGAV